MPMIAAAPLAANRPCSVRCFAASSITDSSNGALRQAIAQLTTVPHVCCGVSSLCRRTLLMLSFKSRAYSGRVSSSCSSSIGLDLGREDEVTLGQTVDLVGPDLHLDLA